MIRHPYFLAIRAAAATVIALGFAASALAQVSAQDSLQQYVEREANASAGTGVRVEVAIGQLNSRVQLAPCAQIEPFIPNGARMWGRTQIGARCVSGAAWSVLLPVTVRIFGPALVATRPLTANQPLTTDDLRSAETELTRDPQGFVTDIAQLDNRVLTRGISMGNPIPLGAVRAPLVVNQGDVVKIMGIGTGFVVSASGQAVGAAQDGQNVRVRTESGKMLSGIARAGHIVEVSL